MVAQISGEPAVVSTSAPSPTRWARPSRRCVVGRELGGCPPHRCASSIDALPHARRLYSDAMIEIAAHLADQHGIGPGHWPTPEFINDLDSGWKQAFAALNLTSSVARAGPDPWLTGRA